MQGVLLQSKCEVRLKTDLGVHSESFYQKKLEPLKIHDKVTLKDGAWNERTIQMREQIISSISEAEVQTKCSIDVQ